MNKIDTTTELLTSSRSIVYPKTINHVAVSVPDLDHALL